MTSPDNSATPNELATSVAGVGNPQTEVETAAQKIQRLRRFLSLLHSLGGSPSLVSC